MLHCSVLLSIWFHDNIFKNFLVLFCNNVPPPHSLVSTLSNFFSYILSDYKNKTIIWFGFWFYTFMSSTEWKLLSKVTGEQLSCFKLKIVLFCILSMLSQWLIKVIRVWTATIIYTDGVNVILKTTNVFGWFKCSYVLLYYNRLRGFVITTLI